MEIHDLPGFVVPLVAAVGAGALIGLEREWRGRAAGLRTHILVSLASALLMEAAVMQGAWRFEALAGTQIVADPTRMAHGVLTGLGFLCAGVIFRTGFSVHGLTTAASLWITAAIGLLFGAGLMMLGVIGTALTVGVLMGLRLISARVPQSVVADASVSWRRESPEAEAAVEAALADLHRPLTADGYELLDDGRLVCRSFRLTKLRPEQLKALTETLRRIDGVVAYRLDPRDD